MFNSKLRSPWPDKAPLNEDGNVLISTEVFSKNIVNLILSIIAFSFSFNLKAISCRSSPIDLKFGVVIFNGSAPEGTFNCPPLIFRIFNSQVFSQQVVQSAQGNRFLHRPYRQEMAL